MMKSFILLLFLGIFISPLNAHETIEPATRQLLDFKLKTKKPVGVLTTNAGAPVEVRDTITINSDLRSNEFFLENLQQIVNERIPEREVHAKGTGAFGYFEVTHDISAICKAKVFNGIGKKTRVAARFSPDNEERGGSDFTRGFKALAAKFYTEEGNLDFLNLHFPIFSFKDPIDFPMSTHSSKRNPATNLRDNTARADFVTLRPDALLQFLYANSDYGIPKGYRKMDVFPIHTFEVYNDRGEKHYVKFNFRSEQGLDNYTSAQARVIASRDPDYFMRDLYNNIANKNYPSWRVEIDILYDIEHVNFDPFDLTKLWPKDAYHTETIGRFVLTTNPKNQFAEIEQLAFNPANLVPGISGPPDQIFQARRLFYRDAARNRLGINFAKIEVNLPKHKANVYYRNGRPPVRDNMKDAPNYLPNSFHGPVPYVNDAKPKARLVTLTSNRVDLQPASYFYNHILKSDGERQRLIDNIIAFLADVTSPVKERAVKLLYLTDYDLGKRVAEGLEAENLRDEAETDGCALACFEK